jgi:hypothetical protein
MSKREIFLRMERRDYNKSPKERIFQAMQKLAGYYSTGCDQENIK